MAEGLDVQVGDWVRFYRGGVLVIGVVHYIMPERWSGRPQAMTDIGPTSVDEVCEVRRQPAVTQLRTPLS